MPPLLWQRVSGGNLSAPHVNVTVLSTCEHRSFELADLPIIFAPQTGIAILNSIANYITTKKTCHRDFLST